MKNKKQNNKYCEIPILNNEYWVYVCIGKDKEELSKKLINYFEDKHNGNFDPDSVDGSRGQCYRKKGYNPYIFVNLNECKTKNQIYATLAHESCHAIDNIFYFIGDNNRHELFAHSVAAVIRGVKDIL